jgi:hypothetical protein
MDSIPPAEDRSLFREQCDVALMLDVGFSRYLYADVRLQVWGACFSQCEVRERLTSWREIDVSRGSAKKRRGHGRLGHVFELHSPLFGERRLDNRRDDVCFVQIIEVGSADDIRASWGEHGLDLGEEVVLI